MPLALVKPCIPVVLLFVHLFVIMTVLFVFVWADTENTEERFLGGLNMGERLFNWHPVFMVWGTTCLLEGAVAFRSMHFYPHGVKKRMHALWNLLGSVLLSAGLAVVFKYKHENHIASLYSTHSWLGIFTSTLVFAQFALGFVAYGSSLLPGCLTTTSVLFKQRAYPIHATLGVTATVAACASVLSGIDHENTLLGCAYSVVNKDLDPAAHYYDIPKGCRLSNGIAVIFMVLLLLVVFVLTNLKSSGAAFSPDNEDANPAASNAEGASLLGQSAGGLGGGFFRRQRFQHGGGTVMGGDGVDYFGGGGGDGDLGNAMMSRAELDQQALLSQRTVYYGGCGRQQSGATGQGQQPQRPGAAAVAAAAVVVAGSNRMAAGESMEDSVSSLVRNPASPLFEGNVTYVGGGESEAGVAGSRLVL